MSVEELEHYDQVMLKLLRERGPRWIEVRNEVPIADERPPLDYLLLRKTSAPGVRDPGQTLRGLWPRLGLVTIVAFKSIGWPYRSGDLDRLWGYLHLYAADERARLTARNELRAVLVVPGRSPSLDEDVEAMQLSWTNLGGGYWQLEGGLFILYVVDIDVVAEQEEDEVLRLFSHARECALEREDLARDPPRLGAISRL